MEKRKKAVKINKPNDPEKIIKKLKRKNDLEYKKRLSPKECLKYMNVLISPDIFNNSEISLQLFDHHKELGNVQVTEKEHFTNGIISWQRECQPTFETTDLGEVRICNKYQEETYIIYLLQSDDVLQNIKDGILLQAIQSVQSVYSDKRLILFIFGGMNKDRNISQKRVEFELTKLQILASVSHQVFTKPYDLGLAVRQITKSIAERLYKEDYSLTVDSHDFYLPIDNKDCVAIDNIDQTVAFSNLWKSHIIRFPMVNIEIADSIIEKYPRPKNLIEAYNSLSIDDGERLLENIPIRRDVGPMSASRRIGPELSRKIYSLYTSSIATNIL